jgi:CO/xanthine dehydrogenase FAD-binding subunit
MGEALAALTTPGTQRVILAGGTVVNATSGTDPVEVVDLQELGLGGISEEDDRLRIGATTTLQELADDPSTPRTLAMLALREVPSTLRTLATIGGLVVHGDPESELLAALLAHGAIVTVVDGEGTAERHLTDVLATGPGAGIISAVIIEIDGVTASARTGRTPGDRPIVAAVARKADDGSIRLALCGVASTPVLVDDTSVLEPPADFRGSAEYRSHLASILAERVKGKVS